VITKFHFDKDIKNKTFLGGFISIMIYSYIIYICFSKGYDIYNQKDSYDNYE
jgi:hypothetical protein